MVVGPVVLDERGDRRDVAGVYPGHAGGTAHRRGLMVQVQQAKGKHRGRRRRDKELKKPRNF